MKKKNVEVNAVKQRWLTTSRACEYLGVSKDFFDNLRAKAEIPFYKVGRLCFYNVEDIDRLIIKNRIV